MEAVTPPNAPTGGLHGSTAALRSAGQVGQAGFGHADADLSSGLSFCFQALLCDAMTKKPTRSLSALAALARKADPDRYVWALFLEPEMRERAFAALSLNHEFRRIPALVSEPVLGQMRFQWWRESLQAIEAGSEAPPHELLRPLVAMVRGQGLSLAPLLDLLEAREATLLGDAPQSAVALARFIAADESLDGVMEGYELLLSLVHVPCSPSEAESVARQVVACGQTATTRPARLLQALTGLYLRELHRRRYNASLLRRVMPSPLRAVVLTWQRIWM